jgi:hypothetical protein
MVSTEKIGERKMITTHKPSHILYQIIERKGKESIWTRIGAAWVHQDGKGFNISFNAIPITGSIVLREYDSSKKTVEEKGE